MCSVCSTVVHAVFVYLFARVLSSEKGMVSIGARRSAQRIQKAHQTTKLSQDSHCNEEVSQSAKQISAAHKNQSVDTEYVKVIVVM